MSVALAQDLAKSMLERECKGSGDLPRAMERLEQRHNLPSGLLRRLRYRSPRQISVTAWQSLVSAYQAECLRQARLLEHELKVTRELSNDLDPNFVRTVERLLEEVRGKTQQ